MSDSLSLILWLQSVRGPLLEAFARLFSFLGTEDFFLLLVPLIYWCIDALLGRRMLILLIFSVWMGNWLKSWWQLPRPFMISDEVRPLLPEQSYGLPSIHTMNAVAIGGSIAYFLKRRWITVLVMFYVVFTGLARMIAGVHFLEDAVAGIIIGLLILFVFISFDTSLSETLRSMSVGVEVLLTLLTAALLFLIHPFLVPADMLVSWEQAYTVIGLLIGAGIGLSFEQRYVRFSAAGPLWKRALRLVLGLAVVMAIRFGLGAAFDDLEPAALYRVIRYTILGLWAAFGAPWAFVRLNLAERRTEPATFPIEAENAPVSAES